MVKTVADIALMVVACLPESKCVGEGECVFCYHYNVCKTNFYMIGTAFNMIIGGNYYG